MIRTFQGIKPTIPTFCFIEETGIVTGDVVFGEHCSVWFHAVIRGDPPKILIFSTPLDGEEACSLLLARCASKREQAPCPPVLSCGIMPPSWRRSMEHLLEYAGSVHIYLGPYRGNPIALYLKRTETGCQIGPKAYPWNDVVGSGETPNKAAADFEEKWKMKGLSTDMYSGPSWEGGIKPEKPAPPKPPAAPKPAVSAAASAPAGQPVVPAAPPAAPADTTPAPAPAPAAQPAGESS
jgi:hypothetical protein